MSDPGFIERLLDGAEVAWKPLGELGELVRGNGLPKKDFTDTGVPAIHYGQIYTHYGLSTRSTISFVSPETAANLRKVNTGDVVITNTSENFEDVATPLVYLGQEQAVTGGHATIFKPIKTVLGMYFAYFTQTPTFAKAKRQYAKGAKVIDVSAKDMSRIPIPVPCPDNPERSLAIQAEVVRVLDAFAELTARRKQYNHYRDKLLTFGGDVEYKPLREVAELSKTRISFDQLDKSNYVGVDNLLQDRGGKVESSYVPMSGNLTEYQKGDVLIGNIRPYLKKIWFADGNGGANGDVLVIHGTDSNIDSRYLYQVLADEKFFIYNMKYAKGAKMPRGSKPQILLYPIPIPFPNNSRKSLAEQARIAAILDKFDALTTSLAEGLPREIDLRQKQYAHYRDLLLDFPKPDGEAA